MSLENLSLPGNRLYLEVLFIKGVPSSIVLTDPNLGVVSLSEVKLRAPTGVTGGVAVKFKHFALDVGVSAVELFSELCGVPGLDKFESFNSWSNNFFLLSNSASDGDSQEGSVWKFNLISVRFK